MAKISLKCENCGAKLVKIELEQDAYICTHCGNKQ